MVGRAVLSVCPISSGTTGIPRRRSPTFELNSGEDALHNQLVISPCEQMMFGIKYITLDSAY